jgi:hypothetical protein
MKRVSKPGVGVAGHSHYVYIRKFYSSAFSKNKMPWVRSESKHNVFDFWERENKNEMDCCVLHEMKIEKI